MDPSSTYSFSADIALIRIATDCLWYVRLVFLCSWLMGNKNNYNSGALDHLAVLTWNLQSQVSFYFSFSVTHTNHLLVHCYFLVSLFSPGKCDLAATLFLLAWWCHGPLFETFTTRGQEVSRDCYIASVFTTASFLRASGNPGCDDTGWCCSKALTPDAATPLMCQTINKKKTERAAERGEERRAEWVMDFLKLETVGGSFL